MNQVRSRLGIFVVLASLGFALLYGCVPPRRTLTSEDKVADMYWLYSQFNENYAPLQYKEARLGFKFEDLKQKYLDLAKATTNNDDFYKLMYQFVAEFHDAHTSASMGQADLPGRAKVAYLGFMGVRKGDNLVVKEFLPTVDRDAANFPVKVSDVITKMDGIDLKTMIQTDALLFRNLGQDESNLTFHMGRLFTRLSTANGLPKAENAKLTLLRSGKEMEITLPWVVKDLVEFSGEQRRAVQQKRNPPHDDVVQGFDPADYFKIGMMRINGRLENTTSALSKIIQNLPSYNFWNSFTFVDTNPAWMDGLSSAVNPKATGDDLMKTLRNVPKTAILIEDSKTYPIYLTRENTLNAKGEASGSKKFVAYMLLNTFGPSADSDTVLAELSNSFKKLNELGVQDLVIDMINNGGGSLELGMKLAQFFSPTKVVMPDIQYRLSETWLDNFEKGSLAESSNDAEREIDRRFYNMMLEDKKAGNRLSRKFNTESLITFPLIPNADMPKLNIVLMVNEMCASMCDIFTAILKDNNMAKVVGSKTMGAGGNVVDHMLAPNSSLSVRQTESLILRADGTYIENNGIEPDVAVKVNELADSKYDEVRAQALKLLLTDTVK